MTLWSKYKAWRHKHNEGSELIIFIVEFFVAFGVIIEIVNKVSDFLHYIDLSFISYPINIKAPLGVFILLVLLLLLLYFFIRFRLKKLKQKLISSISALKDESDIIQTEIHVNISPEISLSTNTNLKYPLKLYFHITNSNEKPIVIDKVVFEATKNIKVHSDSKIQISELTYRPSLYLGTINGQENWDSQAVIHPHKEIKFYIPITNDFGKGALENSLNNKTTGTVLLRVTMLDNELLSKNLKFEF